MFSAENQQMKICLLKSDLEEIGNKLVTQCSQLPVLDAENKQKYEETKAMLQMVRSSNSTIEKLKTDGMYLTVKREQLKRKCNELIDDLETAQINWNELAKALEEENTETDRGIFRYEDTLQEKAERFRRTSRYYDEAEINKELDDIKNMTFELENELSEKQNAFDALKTQVECIQPKVPENVVEICGSSELDDQIKALTEKLETL